MFACPNNVCSTFTWPARRVLTFSRLVAVPGISTLGPEDWIDSNNRSWLRTILAQSASDRALYAFDYTLPASETFSWQSLLDQGDDLLTCLLEPAEVENVSYSKDGPQIKDEGMKYLAGAIPDYCHCGPQLGGTCCQRSGGPTPRTKPFEEIRSFIEHHIEGARSRIVEGPLSVRATALIPSIPTKA